MKHSHRASFARLLDWILLIALILNSVAPVSAAKIPLSDNSSHYIKLTLAVERAFQ
ncbi:MAG: hypothetical protein HZB51_16265 [Chloroflexi bacterium]|nr:hypothetical protein [Chloroflexota bacterium]